MEGFDDFKKRVRASSYLFSSQVQAIVELKQVNKDILNSKRLF